MLRYTLRIWERWLDEHPGAALPPVIPLVLYHGQKAWRSSTQLADLVAVPEALREPLAPYVPAYAFLLEPIAQMPEWAIPGRGFPRLTLMLFRAPDDAAKLEALRGAVEDFGRALERQGQRASLSLPRIVLEYIAEVTESPSLEEIAEILRPAGPRAQELVMTLSERLIEKGREEGREESLSQAAQRMLERGFDAEQVADLLGLTVERVREVEKQR